MAAVEEKLKKLEILQEEAKELAIIKGSNVWRKITLANETQLRDIVSEFATGKELPNEPMQALIYLLKLRSEAAGCLKLIELFNDVEDGNIAGINTILGSRPVIAYNEEDVDLHASGEKL